MIVIDSVNKPNFDNTHGKDIYYDERSEYRIQGSYISIDILVITLLQCIRLEVSKVTISESETTGTMRAFVSIVLL